MMHPPQLLPEILGVQEEKCTSIYPRGKTCLRSEAVGRFNPLPRIVAQGASQPHAALAAPTVQYSGMAATIKKWGIGDTVAQSVELQWQQGVAGKKTKITQ